MVTIIPGTILDLVDAPDGAEVHVGQQIYRKIAPLTPRPWQRDHGRIWVGSQILWERWRKAQETAAGDGDALP